MPWAGVDFRHYLWFLLVCLCTPACLTHAFREGAMERSDGGYGYDLSSSRCADEVLLIECKYASTLPQHVHQKEHY